MPEQTDQSEGFGIDDIRELLRFLGQTDITELRIEYQEFKMKVRRAGPQAAPGSGVPHIAPVLSASALAPLGSNPPHPHPPDESAEAQQADGYTIAAPMVGTFYTAPSPRDPTFVNEGDEIHAGDTVGIIEAMKIMNEIESEVDGRIVQILVQNGQPVEYGQPLMVVEPL